MVTGCWVSRGINRVEVRAAFKQALLGPATSIDETAPPEILQATQVDGGHGRIETRSARVCHIWGNWVPAGRRWPGLACLIAIDAHTENSITGKITRVNAKSLDGHGFERSGLKSGLESIPITLIPIGSITTPGIFEPGAVGAGAQLLRKKPHGPMLI